MYLTKDIVNDIKYPDWIRNHPIFKEIHNFNKIFPKKGLLNDSQGISKYLASSKLELFLLDVKKTNIANKLSLLTQFKDHLNNEIFEAIYLFFLNFDNNCVEIKFDNKIYIYIAKDVYSSQGKLIFKKGMSFFSLIERLNDLNLLTFNLFSLKSFKDFSRLNIPISSVNLKFSCDPWDIATISMRGISTCQSWEGDYYYCLIGSMLDPFVAVIYLESKNHSNEYGSKMLYRSIVRFGLKNKVPVLIMDVIYPEPFNEILSLFKDYLMDKSGLEVFYSKNLEDEYLLKKFSLPNSKIKDLLRCYNYHCRLNKQETLSPDMKEYCISSYQNHFIYDKVSSDLNKELIIAKDVFLGIIRKNIYFNNKVLCSVKLNKITSINNKNELLKRIRDSVNQFYNIFLSEIDIFSFKNSFFLSKKLYLNFLNNKKRIIETLSNNVSSWNGALGLSKSECLSKNDFIIIMSEFLQQPCQALKSQFRLLFSEQST